MQSYPQCSIITTRWLTVGRLISYKCICAAIVTANRIKKQTEHFFFIGYTCVFFLATIEQSQLLGLIFEHCTQFNFESWIPEVIR